MADNLEGYQAVVSALAAEAAASEDAWLRADDGNAAKALQTPSMDAKDGAYVAMGWNVAMSLDRDTAVAAGLGESSTRASRPGVEETAMRMAPL